MSDDAADQDTASTAVEVVYALPDEQTIVRLAHRSGMTAAEAFTASGLEARYPEIARRPLVLGVNGIEAAPESVLEPGDRVEICRPLRLDPRRMRADLASLGLTMGRDGRDN